MVKWKDKYDLAVSLCYTGNRVRVPPLDAELRRVGLEPDVRIWNVPCPFERKLLAGVAAAPDMRRSPALLNSGLGHYRAVKTALGLGAERAVIFEDDVRFMKDLDRLAGIVASAPDDGVALYDLCGVNEKVEDWAEFWRKLEESAENGWAPIANPLSIACYGMDRPAMEWFAECFELALSGRAILKVVDQWLTEGMRHGYDVPVKVAWPLACVQCAVDGSPGNNGCGYGWYGDIGLDLADYAIPGKAAP